jgi:hypothetical protein
MELLGDVLNNVLKQRSEVVTIKVLNSLKDRPKIPFSIIGLASSWLGDNISLNVRAAVLRMLCRPSEGLPEGTLKAIAARLKDSVENIRSTAMDVLGGQLALPSEVIKVIVARLEHSDRYVRDSAVDALRGQSALLSEVLQAIAARLEDSHWYVKVAVVQELGVQSALPSEVVKAIVIQLEDLLNYVAHMLYNLQI